MNLESLANELLLDLFEYFNSIHLLGTFHGLNFRFNNLLFTHFQRHCLNFQSASKHDFDVVCQQNLPSFIDRIISLRLSDDSETPQQIDLFLSRIFTLRQFIHLRSLSLSHIRSTETMKKIMIEWHHLPSLIHLYITNSYFQCDQINLENIVNNIWLLPKLIKCHLDINFECEAHFIAPIVVSSSLEYLSIECLDCSISELARLFQFTPHLRHLRVKMHSIDSNYPELVSTMPSLIKLKLSFCGSFDMMRNLLQNMPNLHYLTGETWNIYMYGHQWEEIIINHLHKLKELRFKMEFEVQPDDKCKDEEVDKLLDSFRTHFWLEEHCWFVRCHWDTEDELRCIQIYTLPYAFFDFPTHTIGTFSKSTCPQDEDHWSYGRVHNLHYLFNLFNNLTLSRIYFPNIHHLYLRFPVDDQFWSVIPNFDRLNSLVVWINDSFPQLQTLLDRAPHLYSIVFASRSIPTVSLVQNTSLSVRRLDFQSDNQYFNDQQCTDLSRSSLGYQCEVLRIRVENRTNIVSLINSMVNLRALSFQSQDDKWTSDDDPLSTTIEDEFLVWLQQHLPSTYAIRRDAIGEIRLWIHRSND